MPRYLYGASVQGIQDFIFETNKLKEIVGASELVKDVCTALFAETLDGSFDAENHIIGAAGKIIHLFPDKEDCEKVVRNFKKRVADFAPGLSISQAVVTLESEIEKGHFDELERKLGLQRNTPIPTFQNSCMAVERSRKTGAGDISKTGNEYLSRGEFLKRQSSHKSALIRDLIGEESLNRFHFPDSETDEIAAKTDGQNKSWIAVVHADGNGLGQAIMRMMQEVQDISLASVYKRFSQQLDGATKAAAQDAFRETFLLHPETSGGKIFIPIRPVLLGGDDLTIIIRGDKALPFTHAFLRHFEAETKALLADIGWDGMSAGLSACAGIAYIKPHYPFHYAAHLAEELTRHAKNIAKSFTRDKGARVPSGLMFHQVYSSFTGSYSDLAAQELTGKDKNNRFDFGPYFLQTQNGYASLDELNKWIGKFSSEEAPRASLRTLATYYADGREADAKQYANRILSFPKKAAYLRFLGIESEDIFTRKAGTLRFSPISDVIRMAELHARPEQQEAS